jgi:competence protein ComEC
MEFLKKYWREIALLILVIGNATVWYSYDQRKPSELLRVYFFDIGQGDSIFIDSPSHGRVLIDGGPNRSVLSELGKILPFYDKRIDFVIETHPDKDHIGGLPEVLNRYNVGMFMEPGVESENKIDDELHKVIKEKNIPTVLARRGMVINFQDETKLQILFPNQDVSRWETNDASIVAKLMYGDKSFLFTGDSPTKAENILMSMDKNILDSDILKVGHHGSRTSTSFLYAEVVSPEYAIISAGKNNSYGHPHKETLDSLNKVGAKILSTINLGTIKIETDGKNLIIK